MSNRTEKIEIYREIRDRIGVRGIERVPEWRWRYKATNGKILADGGEGYKSRADAVHGALRVTGLDRKRGNWTITGVIYAFFAGSDFDRPYDVELVQR